MWCQSTSPYFSLSLSLFSLSSLLPTTIAILMNDALGPTIGETEFAALMQEPMVLVAFTSRSFEPVQRFAAVFEEAVEKVNTPCVVVDCDEAVGLCERLDVNSYPTVRLFKKDIAEDKEEDEEEWDSDDEEEDEEMKKKKQREKEEQEQKEKQQKEETPQQDDTPPSPQPIRYRGPRTPSAIRSFIIKHEYPPLVALDPGALPAFKSIDDRVVIAYLRPDQAALKSTFRAVARKHRYEFIFAATTHAPDADAEGRAVPSVVCYRDADGDHKVHSGAFGEEDVERVLARCGESVIREFSERRIEAFMVPSKLTAYIFSVTEAQARALRHALTPLAKKYEKVVTFGVADAVEYGPMAEGFGLRGGVWPALAVHAPVNDQAFTLKQGVEITAVGVEDMLVRILKAEAKPGQVFGGEKPHDEL